MDFLNDLSWNVIISRLLVFTTPFGASLNLCINLIIVDLPNPLLPTKAIDIPASISSEKPWNIIILDRNEINYLKILSHLLSYPLKI